jgi:hypothetical protein
MDLQSVSPLKKGRGDSLGRVSTVFFQRAVRSGGERVF